MMKLPIFMTLTAWLSSVTCVNSAYRCQKGCDEGCGKAKKQSVMIVLLLLLTLTSVPVQSKDTNTCQGVAITPRDRIFLSGQNVVLTCTLDKQPENNKTTLLFKRGKDYEIVSKEYITFSNSTTIKVSIPLRDEDIPGYRGSMKYLCYKVDPAEGETCVDSIYVRADYHPVKAENLTCRIYDYDSMDCKWSLVYDYVQKTEVACEVITVDSVFTNLTYVSGQSYNDFASCPNQTKTSCHWNGAQYTDAFFYIIRVRVTKENLNISRTTKNYIFQAYDILEPGSVTDVEVIADRNGSRCARVQWKPSSSLTFRNSTHLLTYSSTCDDEYSKIIPSNIQRGGKADLISTRICGLNPHTHYSIGAQSKLVHKGKEAGFWSSSTSIEFLTPSDVPDVSPVSSSLEFELIDADNAVLYWQPLDPCEMHSSTSELYYDISHSNGRIGGTKFSTVVEVSGVTNVTIAACNKNGKAKQISGITVFPKHMSPVPSELVIQYNGTEGCKSIFAMVIVKTDKQNYFTNIRHELVWCRGHSTCNSPLKKISLVTGVTTYALPSDHCYGNYSYGLVTKGRRQGDERSSGIYWNNCEYQLGKVPDEPLSVSLSTLQPDNGVLINWQKYECTKDNTGFITGYTVAFCLDDGEKQCNCEKQIRTNISSEASSFTIDNLDKGENVCIWIRGDSLAGPGLYNVKPLIHTVSSDEKSDAVWIILLAVLGGGVVIAVGTFVVMRLYRKAKKWYRKNSSILMTIKIPKREEGSKEYTNVKSKNPNQISRDVLNTEAKEPLLKGYEKVIGENTDPEYVEVNEEVTEETDLQSSSLAGNSERTQEQNETETVRTDTENEQSVNAITDSRNISELTGTCVVPADYVQIDDLKTVTGHCIIKDVGQGYCVMKEGQGQNVVNEPCPAACNVTAERTAIGFPPGISLQTHHEQALLSDNTQTVVSGDINSHIDHLNSEHTLEGDRIDNPGLLNPNSCADSEKESIDNSENSEHKREEDITGSVILPVENQSRKSSFESEKNVNLTEKVASKIDENANGQSPLGVTGFDQHSNGEDLAGRACDNSIKPRLQDINSETCLPNHGSVDGEFENENNVTEQAITDVRNDLNNNQETHQSITMPVESENSLAEYYRLSNTNESDSGGYVDCIDSDEETVVETKEVVDTVHTDTPVKEEVDTVHTDIHVKEVVDTVHTDIHVKEVVDTVHTDIHVKDKGNEDVRPKASLERTGNDYTVCVFDRNESVASRNESVGSRDSGRESLSADTEKPVDTDQQYTSLESEDSGHDSTHAINNLSDPTTNNSDLESVDTTKHICDDLMPKRNSADSNSEFSTDYMVISEKNDNHTRLKNGSNDSQCDTLQTEECKLKHEALGKHHLEKSETRFEPTPYVELTNTNLVFKQ